MTGRGREHPLLNNLVAKEILKYSSLEDLAGHRLVCKTWFDASLTQWRSTATLNVLQRKSIGKQVVVASGSGSKPPSTITVTEMAEPHSLAHNDAGGCGGVTLSKLKMIVAKKDKKISSSFLQLDRKPFAKYKLKKWTIQDARSFAMFDEEDDQHRKFEDYNKKELICGAENFPQFWQKFGPLMKFLTIDEFEFLPVLNVPLLAIIFQHTPNLVELKLSRNDFPSVNGLIRIIPILHQELPLKINLKTLSVQGELLVSFTDVIKAFPNLESLTINGWNPWDEVSTVFQAGLVNSELSLKHLNITMYHANAGADFVIGQLSFRNALSKLEITGKKSDELKRLLPLRTLELGAMRIRFNGAQFLASVSTLLEDYAKFGRLEVIKLYMTPFCPSSSKQSVLSMRQRMESVKHFEIWGNWLHDIAFLRWMPNLERLEVNISCFEKWDQIRELGSDANGLVSNQPFVTNINEDVVRNALNYGEMRNYVGVQLKSLYIDYEFGQKSLVTLRRWMPNLNELKTILNNETLSTVCTLWSDLEILDLLYGSTVDDQGIVGVGKKKPEQNRKQQINLTSLQNLKSFRLETYCGKSKLGDISATEGFLKMDALQTLEICVSAQMSLEVEAELKKAIGNAKIIRNYGEKEPAHLSYGKCCKRLQFLSAYVEGARQILADESDEAEDI